MQTQERPPTNRNQTYSQTDAAVACGVSQRALVDRNGKKGYLGKLYYCFPGQYWELVAVGELKEQEKVRLTTRGVEELRELIQALSPEPPLLDDNKKPVKENGKVVKVRGVPKYTLVEYAESIWFVHQIDGAGEHRRFLQEESQKCAPTREQSEAIALEAELVETGAIVSIDGSAENWLELAFTQLDQNNIQFWNDLDQAYESGKLQGRLLAAAQLKGMTEGQSEILTEHSMWRS